MATSAAGNKRKRADYEPGTKQVFTVVRQKLNTLLTPFGRDLLFEEYVADANRALAEVHLLSTLYVIERVANGKQVGKLDQSFFARALKEVCQGGNNCKRDKHDLARIGTAYRQARHPQYQAVRNSEGRGKDAYLGSIFYTLARSLATNVSVSIQNQV